VPAAIIAATEHKVTSTAVLAESVFFIRLFCSAPPARARSIGRPSACVNGNLSRERLDSRRGTRAAITTALDVGTVRRRPEKPLIQELLKDGGAGVPAQAPQPLDLVSRQPEAWDLEELTAYDLDPLTF
jgi:hypothetical protein